MWLKCRLLSMSSALLLIMVGGGFGWKWTPWLLSLAFRIPITLLRGNFVVFGFILNTWLIKCTLWSRVPSGKETLWQTFLQTRVLKFQVMFGGITRLLVLLNNSTLILGEFPIFVFISFCTLLFSIIFSKDGLLTSWALLKKKWKSKCKLIWSSVE